MKVQILFLGIILVLLSGCEGRKSPANEWWYKDCVYTYDYRSAILCQQVHTLERIATALEKGKVE